MPISVKECFGMKGTYSMGALVCRLCQTDKAGTIEMTTRNTSLKEQPKPKGTRKVEQLCLKTGRVLARFDSISAASKAAGITTVGISYCCNGRNASVSAGGFGWRVLKTDEQLIISEFKQMHRIF